MRSLGSSSALVDRLLCGLMAVATAATPLSCKLRGEDGAGAATSLKDGPSADKSALVSVMSDQALDELASAVDLLFRPQSDQERLQSRLYWCAIYALWSAFPVGKLAGKVPLKDFIRQNASARGGRVVDVYNVLQAVKQLASGEDATLDQRLTQAFSLMQLLNHAFGGSKLASGALNLVDTLSQCGLAIHDGSKQLIADIKKVNEEYSTREIWDASREALGPVAGPPVFVVIAGGNQVIKTGEAAGEWLGDLAYPPANGEALSTSTTVQCCTVNRIYEYWNGFVWRKCDWNATGDTWLYVQTREISYPHSDEEHGDQGPRSCKGSDYSRENIRMRRTAFDCSQVARSACGK